MPNRLSTKKAFGLALLLVLLLGSPVFLHYSGAYRRVDIFPILPREHGGFELMQRELAQEKEDLDIVFMGSSILWTGIDTPAVQNELSTVLERPARVLTLSHNFDGLDLEYAMLKRLLAKKKLRMLVMNMKTWPEFQTEGNASLNSRWFQYGDDELPPTTTKIQRFRQYALSLLGAPRQLLGALRTDKLPDTPFCGERLGALRREVGFEGSPFERFQPASEKFSAEKATYSKETAASYDFSGAEPTAYEKFYLEKIGKLLNENGVRLVVLYVPMWQDRASWVVPFRTFWPKVMGTDAVLMGVPPVSLFEGLEENEVRKLFFNRHLNANGQEYFTNAIKGALVENFVREPKCHGDSCLP